MSAPLQRRPPLQPIFRLRFDVTTATGKREERPGGRFAFGKNWSNFLEQVDEENIRASQEGLKEMLGPERLDGLSFLDIGSGSGLSSLAARRLGARVHSFDYDPDSVMATRELKGRFHPDDDEWSMEQGSVLDPKYMESLGQFDLVYSWGVLHHTGDMWTAISAAAGAVRPGGRLFLALYNDDGSHSRLWRAEKRLYVRSPPPVQWALVAIVGGYLGLRGTAARGVRNLRLLPRSSAGERKIRRGMSRWHDLVDWVGGYPFEFARPGEVFERLRSLGFQLEAMRTHPGSGSNNEFVFRKPA